MNVFIAWSGPYSEQVASALYSWFPRVIQAVKPWMSNEDIYKGRRWEKELATELENANFGIICLTPDNLESTWLHFEAGALAKAPDVSLVWTYLFRIEHALDQPLGAFQHTVATKEDTLLLLKSIHSVIVERGEPTAEWDNIKESFDRQWDDLEEKLSNISEKEVAEEKIDDENKNILSKLNEILVAVRRPLFSSRTVTTSPSSARSFSFTRSSIPEIDTGVHTHYQRRDPVTGRFTVSSESDYPQLKQRFLSSSMIRLLENSGWVIQPPDEKIDEAPEDEPEDELEDNTES